MSEGYVIRIIGVAGTITLPTTPGLVGTYVSAYDPDAHDGRGNVDGVAHPWEALVFATPHDAMAEWKRVSTVRPVRADGRPNRPMTCFTVEVLSLDDARKDWLDDLGTPRDDDGSGNRAARRAIRRAAQKVRGDG